MHCIQFLLASKPTAHEQRPLPFVPSSQLPYGKLQAGHRLHLFPKYPGKHVAHLVPGSKPSGQIHFPDPCKPESQ